MLSMETATYETTLTADALTSLVGVVHCIAGNDRGSITSNNITISSKFEFIYTVRRQLSELQLSESSIIRTHTIYMVFNGYFDVY